MNIMTITSLVFATFGALFIGLAFREAWKRISDGRSSAMAFILYRKIGVLTLIIAAAVFAVQFIPLQSTYIGFTAVLLIGYVIGRLHSEFNDWKEAGESLRAKGFIGGETKQEES